MTNDDRLKVKQKNWAEAYSKMNETERVVIVGLAHRRRAACGIIASIAIIGDSIFEAWMISNNFTAGIVARIVVLLYVLWVWDRFIDAHEMYAWTKKQRNDRAGS